MNTHGGKRAGAGRPALNIKKIKRTIAISNEDWQMIKQSSKSERKVADFIVEAVKFYNKCKEHI
ncbi:MAG: hypothetical protein ROM03_04315 [Mucispirillum sp.]|nr:hypothetical protein [Mucispirillum sp.]